MDEEMLKQVMMMEEGPQKTFMMQRLMSAGQGDTGTLERASQGLNDMGDSEEATMLRRQLFQDYEGQEQLIEDDLATAAITAEAGAMPTGIQTNSGFVAANPLEFIGAFGNTAISGQQRANALRDRRALSDDRTAGVTAMSQMGAEQAVGSSAGQQVAPPMLLQESQPQDISKALRMQQELDELELGPQ